MAYNQITFPFISINFLKANDGTPLHDTAATFFKTSMLPTIKRDAVKKCKNGRCRKLEVLPLSKRSTWLNPFCGLLHFLVCSGLPETKSSLPYSLAVCAGVVNKMASPATSMGHTTLLWPQVLAEGHSVPEIKMKKIKIAASKDVI